jgi:Nucleotide-diphospho-sugar transferase
MSLRRVPRYSSTSIISIGTLVSKAKELCTRSFFKLLLSGAVFVFLIAFFLLFNIYTTTPSLTLSSSVPPSASTVTGLDAGNHHGQDQQQHLVSSSTDDSIDHNNNNNNDDNAVKDENASPVPTPTDSSAVTDLVKSISDGHAKLRVTLLLQERTQLAVLHDGVQKETSLRSRERISETRQRLIKARHDSKHQRLTERSRRQEDEEVIQDDKKEAEAELRAELKEEEELEKTKHMRGRRKKNKSKKKGLQTDDIAHLHRKDVFRRIRRSLAAVQQQLRSAGFDGDAAQVELHVIVQDRTVYMERIAQHSKIAVPRYAVRAVKSTQSHWDSLLERTRTYLAEWSQELRQFVSRRWTIGKTKVVEVDVQSSAYTWLEHIWPETVTLPSSAREYNLILSESQIRRGFLNLMSDSIVRVALFDKFQVSNQHVNISSISHLSGSSLYGISVHDASSHSFLKSMRAKLDATAGEVVAFPTAPADGPLWITVAGWKSLVSWRKNAHSSDELYSILGATVGEDWLTDNESVIGKNHLAALWLSLPENWDHFHKSFGAIVTNFMEAIKSEPIFLWRMWLSRMAYATSQRCAYGFAQELHHEQPTVDTFKVLLSSTEPLDVCGQRLQLYKIATTIKDAVYLVNEHPQKSSGIVIVVTINDSPLLTRLMDNFICSLRKFGALDDLLIHATTESAAHRYAQRGISVFLSSDANAVGTLHFGTVRYQRLILQRTQLVDALLQSSSLDVLLTDADTVWLRDVRSLLSSDDFKSFDLLGEDNLEFVSGGFLFMRNTAPTRDLWHIVAKQHEEIIQLAVARGARKHHAEQMELKEETAAGQDNEAAVGGGGGGDFHEHPFDEGTVSVTPYENEQALLTSWLGPILHKDEGPTMRSAIDAGMYEEHAPISEDDQDEVDGRAARGGTPGSVLSAANARHLGGLNERNVTDGPRAEIKFSRIPATLVTSGRYYFDSTFRHEGNDFSDTYVVHLNHLTANDKQRRMMDTKGLRFLSTCDDACESAPCIDSALERIRARQREEKEHKDAEAAILKHNPVMDEPADEDLDDDQILDDAVESDDEVSEQGDDFNPE